MHLPSESFESRTVSSPAGLVVKPANIRIWIHDRDMAKLQQLLWGGHGARLRNQTSKYPIVKRFLEGVPFVMVRAGVLELECAMVLSTPLTPVRSVCRGQSRTCMPRPSTATWTPS